MPHGSSRSRPKRCNALATRERIYVAGCKAFAAKGLDATNLREDIIQPAGVAVGSFYHQFKDKADLLLSILDVYSGQFRERIDAQLRPTTLTVGIPDLTARTLEDIFDLADSEPEVTYIVLREQHSSDPMIRRYLQRDRRIWLAHLSESITELATVNGAAIDADGLAEMILTLAEGSLANYLELEPSRRPGERARLLRNLITFVLGGINAFTQQSTVLPSEPASGALLLGTREDAEWVFGSR